MTDTRKVYSIDVPIWATAYIKADSPEEALKLAQELEHSSPGIEDSDGDVWISGLRLDDEMLPDVSLSPAMTIHRAPDDSVVELAHDPEDNT